MRLLAIAPTSSSQTINVDVIVPYGRGRASFFLHYYHYYYSRRAPRALTTATYVVAS
jgi:hypothetical protein